MLFLLKVWGSAMATEPRAGGDADGQAETKPALSDSECLLSPDRQGIQVAGVPLNNPSSIAPLRAGCKYLGISQAGSKFKLLHRFGTTCGQVAFASSSKVGD